MLVDFGKANPLAKARQQPDKVRQVLEKVRTDGLAPTLAAVRNKLEQPHPLLMVGFNRRFAPQVQKIKALLAGVTGPKALVMTVNAGAIPAEHWTQDPAVGGGRIIGEACHILDEILVVSRVTIDVVGGGVAEGGIHKAHPSRNFCF